MLTITLLLVVAIISPSLGAPPTSPKTGKVVKRQGNGTTVGDGEYDAILTIYRFNQIIDQMVNTWTKVKTQYSKKGNLRRLFNPRQAKENKALNEEVDKLLADVAAQVGSDLACPDIGDSGFGWEFKAWGCHFSDLKTINRDGNAVIENTEDSLTVRLSISFGLLSFVFDDYEVDITGPYPPDQHGRIKGTIHRNSFQFVLQFKKNNPDCQAQLISLSLVNWETPLDLDITDDSKGTVYDGIQESFQGEIKPALENLISSFINDALKKVKSSQICNIGKN